MRHLLLQKAIPDDTVLSEVMTGDHACLRKQLFPHLIVLFDLSITIAHLGSLLKARALLSCRSGSHQLTRWHSRPNSRSSAAPDAVSTPTRHCDSGCPAL
jgi:hypothetical protein